MGFFLVIKKMWKIYTIFLLTYWGTILLDYLGFSIVAGVLLLCGAVYLYICFYRISGSFVDFRAILSLFWLGGLGISVMRLSHLQDEWTTMSWLSFGLFYLLFLVAYELMLSWLAVRKPAKPPKKEHSPQDMLVRLYQAILITAAVTYATFIVEVIIIGYIPVFADFPHAYDSFHVTGIHYITVSCMFVHSLTLIYCMIQGSLPRGRQLLYISLANIMALSVPILCITKFQLALAFVLPVIIYLLMMKAKNIPWKKVLRLLVAIGAVLIAGAIFMTLQRNYEPGYLDDIFEMRYSMPTMIQYAYMYIANNYSNFNALTEAMASGAGQYAFGMKQLFPVFALTGLKFVYPKLVNYPNFVTKTELNTLTLIYDAYYDFGLLGVIGFAIILGCVCAWIFYRVKKGTNPIRFLLYGQIAMYLMLSFFSAWFTVPTTWFWFALTLVLYIWVRIPVKERVE